MGWSWFRPVTIRSVLGCVLGWTGLEHDSHIQVFYRERRHFNDTALTWSNTVNGWTSKYLKFLAESVYISQPVSVNMGFIQVFQWLAIQKVMRVWHETRGRVDPAVSRHVFPVCVGACVSRWERGGDSLRAAFCLRRELVLMPWRSSGRLLLCVVIWETTFLLQIFSRDSSDLKQDTVWGSCDSQGLFTRISKLCRETAYSLNDGGDGV